MIKISDQIHKKMMGWRHDFHAHPETAFEEIRTAQKIKSILLDAGFPNKDIFEGIAKTGIVAKLQCQASSDSPAIAFRADMDALAIDELNSIAYKSQHSGVMHACGHDGHMAMLLGAVENIVQHKDQLKGTLYFVFQPAEENEGGAQKMIEAGFLNDFPCDEIYGMHNYPGLAEGIFSVRSGAMMASFDNFDIIITGKGGHAAYPQNTIDPVIIASQIISSLQTIVSRSHPQNPSVLSVTRMDAGTTYNIIPDSATLRGTVRTLDPVEQDRIENRLKELAMGIAEAHGAKARVIYKRAYPVTMNAEIPTRKAQRVIRDFFGEKYLDVEAKPSMGSEDFSFFAHAIPACYVRLGAGIAQQGEGLHNSKYDFNDNLLNIGANYWSMLANQLLGQSHSKNQ